MELYNKVVDELGENKDYEHIAQVMVDKGWLKRLDNDMFLEIDSEGRRRYEVKPYYILTNKGLKELKREISRYKRPNIRWDIIVSILSIVVTILLQKCVG